MLIEDIVKTPLEKLQIVNKDLIPVVDIIKIDNRLFGRFDLIIKQYFYNELELLPLFYLFNGITNPIEVNLGMLLQIPDYIVLMDHLKVLDLDLENDNIPGVIRYTDNKRVNIETRSNSKNTTKTTALPKLGITTNKAVYDSKLGKLIL
jgi:hypothetical protein